ncbi:MAG: ATP-binding cassette domain-containing protein, partial [Blastocatellia bacterium]
MSSGNGGVLDVRQLNAWYESGERDLKVFSQVSFTVEPGQIVGVFGPNGAGKTTLVKS